MSDKVTVDISPIANSITVAPITTSVEIINNTTSVELKSVTYENNISQTVTNVDITPTTTTVEATVNTTTVDISPNTTTVGVGDASIVASNLASATNITHDSNSWITGGNVQVSFDNLATTADSRYVNVTGDTMTGTLTATGFIGNVTGQVSDLSNHTFFSGSYDDLDDKPTLFDGAYNSLSGKPTLFDGAYNSLSGTPTLFSGSYDDLDDKPTLFDGAYNTLTGKPTLFSGSYNDLDDKPTLFDGAYNTLTGKPTLFDGDYSSLSNKPTLFDGAYNSLSGKPTLFSGSYNDLDDKPTLVTSIGGLSDVDITTTAPTNDQVLVWSTDKFVPADQSGSGGVDLTAFSVGSPATASGSGALGYNNTSGVFTYTPPNLSSYLTSETTTSLALESNVLKYTDEEGTENEIDISLYLDDTNLSRLTSGTLDSSNGTATFTRSDSTTFTVDFSSLINSAEVNDLSSSVTWADVPNANITEGSVTQHQAALSLTESQISNLGSYLTSETSHDDVLVDGDFTTNGFMKRTGDGTYTVDTNTYLTSETSHTDVLVDGDFTTNGFMKRTGDGTYTVDTNTYLTSETSHTDVLVDGDFTSNGFMKRTGDGTYTVDTNTYLTSETSHTDVLVDGDFTTNGFMKRTGDGTYTVDTNTYLTSETSHDDVLVDGDFTTNGLMKRTGEGTYTVDTNTYITGYTETDPIVGAIDGIVKADGAGNISAAVGGTSGTIDYSTVKIGIGATDALAGDTTFAFADITTKPTTISGYGITDAHPDIHSFAWTTMFPMISTGSGSSLLSTSYLTTENMFLFDSPAHSTNKHRTFNANYNYLLNYAGTEMTQVVISRLQFKAPGASTSRVLLGTANYHSGFGNGYGARTKWYISGNVTRYLSAAKVTLTSFQIGGSVTKLNSDSPSSMQRWNIEAYYYDSTDDRTYFFTPYNGASQILSSGGSSTVYLDPFGFTAANTWVTFGETKTTTRLAAYGLADAQAQSVILPYGSYALEGRIQFRKGVPSGTAYLNDLAGSVTAITVQ